MGIGLPAAKFLDISPSPPAPLPGGEGREPANPLPSQREMVLLPDRAFTGLVRVELAGARTAEPGAEPGFVEPAAHRASVVLEDGHHVVVVLREMAEDGQMAKEAGD